MDVHHITPPRKRNLSTFIKLYASCTLFVGTTPSFNTVGKNSLETELEALMTKSSFPFSLRITLATITGSFSLHQCGTQHGTQLLQLKTEDGTQQKSNPRDLGTQIL